MADNNTPQCPVCGHFFYNDQPVEDGLCKYCVKEKKNSSSCYFCGAIATCSGYVVIDGNSMPLCSSESCHKKHEQLKDSKVQNV